MPTLDFDVETPSENFVPGLRACSLCGTALQCDTSKHLVEVTRHEQRQILLSSGVMSDARDADLLPFSFRVFVDTTPKDGQWNSHEVFQNKGEGMIVGCLSCRIEFNSLPTLTR